MFASTNENFWSIWSIGVGDQIRHSSSQDRDFHGCTGSPFKRQPTPNKSNLLRDRNTSILSTGRVPSSQPSPILKKSLVKVKSDLSLPSTPLLGNNARRHNVYSAGTSR